MMDMSEKKDNPYVSGETCQERMKSAKELVDEKFTSLKNIVVATGAVITIILTAVTFALKLWKG